MPFYVEALITAIAPAIFEEVLFRGIFIHNLRKNDYSDMKCLWITTVFFAVAHLTNLVGLAPLSVAIQLVYSFDIGLVLAAIYLKNGSITQVILVHFLIDFTSGIYVDTPTSTSWTLIGAFGVFIVAESAYAVWLTSKTDPPEKGHDHEEIC